MSSEPSRRSFFSIATGLLASVPLLGGLFVALRAGLAPAHTEKPQRIPLCRADQVPDDGILQRSVSFQMRRGPAVESISRVIFVTKDPQSGEMIAMSGECTHLTCPIQLKEVKLSGDATAPLTCPCHGGAFSRTGEVLDGPPPRPLRRLRMDIPDDPQGMIHLLEI